MWTGGKPADWTVLDTMAHGYEQATQLHQTYKDKGFQTHCTGFEAKFTKSSELWEFAFQHAYLASYSTSSLVEL